MKKCILFLAVVVIFLAPVSANAGFLGEYCWKLDPFSDVIKVSVEQNGKHYDIHGIWKASVMAAVDGSAVVVGDDIELHYTSTDLIDTGWSWHFHAKMGPTLNGTWAFERNDSFTNSGTFTSISCPTSLPETTGPDANSN